ncbi:MAG: ABC-three component system protein [Acidimicrobiales bacterium]
MIVAIRANKSTFRTVRFKPGLNLIFAERTKESTRKDSRNGLGKSTVFDIVHFCLGGRATKGKGIVRDDLADWVFSVDLELGGRALTLTRSVAEPRKIQLHENGASPGDGLDIVAGTDEISRRLGRLAFGLTEQEESTNYAPTFRSLFSYLVRRGSEAYLSPFLHHQRQQAWDQQVNVAYHLGIDWEDAREAKLLADDSKLVKALKQASKSSAFTNRVGTQGELEVERVRLTTVIEAQRRRLEEFRVHEDYRAIEVRANELTEVIHRLSNSNQQDRRFLGLYQQQMSDEAQGRLGPAQVADVYTELGLRFPDGVRQRLDQVEVFHNAVVHNRRAFLEDEIDRLEKAISEREAEIQVLDAERARQMQVLKTHGALDEYQELQARLTELQTRLGDIEARIARLRELTDASSQLIIRKRQMEQRARLRFDELTTQRDRAISLFNANTEALYQAPGNLIIDVGPSGFRFNVEIERADSEGVSNMKIYCFDLMLSQLWTTRQTRLGFLMHDSTLFDPVDERQVASALLLAKNEAERLGFQYICAMNSDAYPRDELPDDLSIDDHMAVLLTDTTEDGMLLGRRF